MYSSDFKSLSDLVRQSTACSIISHRKSWSEIYPLRIGVEAERADMIGVKGRNMSYRYLA